MWIFLIGYGFSMFMKNPEKKIVLKVRLIFMIILGISTGYLYLLENLKLINETSLGSIQQIIIEIGLLKINLGYIELYTFLQIFPLIRSDVFLGCLIFLIFISLLIICGKIIKKTILSIINFFKKKKNQRKEKERIQKEIIRVEKQAQLEKEIFDEICIIQKKYKEKDEEAERKNEENDISIEISEKERDITTTGISVDNKN
ncbi:MAG: hypothetical protein ACRC0R_06175 [Cetobacterium sp.]